MDSISSEHSVVTPPAGTAAAHERWGAGERRQEAPVRVRLELQARAPGNLRRHVVRSVRRVLVLLVADLASFWIMRELMRAVRDDRVLGQLAAHSVSDALPQGLFVGWQYAIALVISLAIFGNYREGDARHSARRLFLACALATALPLWSLAWVRGVPVVAGEYLLTVALVSCGLFFERSVLDRVADTIAPPERRAPRTVLVGPAADCAEAAAGRALSDAALFRTIGVIDAADIPAPGALGTVREFARILPRARAEVVVICGYLSDAQFREVVDASLAAGCQVISVPRAMDVARVQPTVVWREGQPFVHLTAPTLTGWELALKRVVDFGLSGAGMLIAAPLFAGIALAVALDSRGPIFFRQERIGRGGKRFRIAKFRTMVVGAESQRDRLLAQSLYTDARLFKMPDDPRITRLGRWLRRTSLDELPQLWNVFTGAMSLVGPRPPLPSEVALYEQHHYARFDVKPGITGPWQVSGRNDVTDFEEVVKLETAYIRNWSLARDVAILLKTFPVVLDGRGAH